MLASLSILLNSILPGLLTGLTGIPIPDPGLGVPLSVVGIQADGPMLDYVSIFLD